jgi:ribonucleoside-diphosphate reductase alpha chain
MNRMFHHKGKSADLVGKRKVSVYQELYSHITELQDEGVLPYNGNYLNGNELAQNLYAKKYFLKDLNNNLIEHSPEDVFKRISSFIATVESTRPKQRKWAEKFYHELYEGRFISGGRVLAGSGDLYRIKTLANCFVTKIDKDSIDSIYKAAYECARTYSYGGGIGVDISCLRPKDAIVHNAADSSTGAVSFMDLFSLTTGLIGQSGRRGALMLTIDVKHPDILHFINVKKVPNWVTNQIIEQCKHSGQFSDKELETVEKQVMENTQIRFANISIKASDEFMYAVDEQKKYGEHQYLIYKKFNRKIVRSAPQSDKLHYSEGMPSKSLKEYEFFESFNSFTEMNNWLFQNYGQSCNETNFNNKNDRDVFGDYIIELSDNNFDLSLRQSGDFLLYFGGVETGDIKELVKAREIWDAFIEGNYKTAEPGLIFWTTMSNYSPSNYVGRPIISTNPCAEVPLEDGGACNLGSLNLSRFVDDGYTDKAKINWDQLAETTSILVRFLDNVVTWNEDMNALEKQRISAEITRRLGLGIMGIADMMNQMAIGYDSQEGINLMERLMSFIANAAFQASAGLAEEKSPSSAFNERKYLKCPFVKEGLSKETQQVIREKGLRNIAILSIAPTGSISNIILSYQHNGQNYIGVSGGVEPIFALYYNRRSESLGRHFKVFHSTVQAYIDKMGIQDEVDKTKNIEDILPPYFLRTAHLIDPISRVEMQGVCQKYIDHSISSTVNLQEDVRPEVISDIYLLAWKNKLKGITIYRDGSRFPVLSTESKQTTFKELKDRTYKLTQDDGTIAYCQGDEILKMPDGSLTTVYHYLKKDNDSIEELIN